MTFRCETSKAMPPTLPDSKEPSLEERLLDIEEKERSGSRFLPPGDEEPRFSWLMLLAPFWGAFRFFEYLVEERDRRKRAIIEAKAARQVKQHVHVRRQRDAGQDKDASP